MSEKRVDLMDELIRLQNMIDYQDVLTVSAFMNDEELTAHVERVRKQVSK